MAEKQELHHPWLVAVWPGMGQVALNAGFYLLAKLEMQVIAELEANDLFDVDHVEVKEGILQTGRRPRNRFFLWVDPDRRHDLVVFLGETQPPIGKYSFCKQLIEYAKELKVERVFTFAAMATRMRPDDRPHVYGIATEAEGLEELKRLELDILQDGHVSGLNGVLLGVAAENGLRGTCLLGEIPYLFNQLPLPRASLAILEVFNTITRMDVDLADLAEQARRTEEQYGELLAQFEQAYDREPGSTQEEYQPETPEPPRLSKADEERIEELFEQSKKIRSRAFTLKQVLDQLGVFKEYEDRFLDLFKKGDL